MPKQMLSGTLDEQCAFLYELGREKMEKGNYTGAAHAFGEIVKYAPNYRDSAELLETARRRKSDQRVLIISAFVGATVLIGIGTWTQLGNDLLLLVLALIGAALGYIAGNWVIGWRRGRGR